MLSCLKTVAVCIVAIFAGLVLGGAFAFVLGEAFMLLAAWTGSHLIANVVLVLVLAVIFGSAFGFVLCAEERKRRAIREKTSA